MRSLSFQTLALAFVLGLLLSMGFWNLPLEAAEGQDQIVIVKIDGLSCPFCAYGVEKKLKTLEGLKDIQIKMNEGEVLITFKAGVTIDVAAIQEAVVDSGFTAREVILPKSQP